MRIKNNSTFIKLSAVALFIAIFAISCKPKPPTPPNKSNCEAKGKFAKGLCLPSIYNNFVIIENGTNEYLVPCESDVPIPQNIKVGQAVEFSFEEQSLKAKGSKCKTFARCYAMPDKPYRYVKITCIKTKSSVNQ